MKRADFYKEKRKNYMLPPLQDGVIEHWETSIPMTKAELRRSLDATFTALIQADQAYLELTETSEK